MFNATLVMESNNVARITLEGELDASVAQVFQEKIGEAASKKARCLVLEMDKLQYMASAGIRVLVFAKQKMGAAVDIYAVAPQEDVLDSIKMTGLDHSLLIVDSMDRAKLAAL